MAENESTASSSYKTWMFNPFHYLAGGKALGLGLCVILLGGVLGFSGNVHLDGVLDWHPTSTITLPMWFFLAEGLVDWLCLAFLLMIAGMILSRSRVRPLDVLGTQALARWPMLVAALVGFVPAIHGFSNHMAARILPGLPSAEASAAVLAIGIICTVIVILMIVWMVALLYRGYAVSCNLRGAKAVVSFIVVLLLAEAASKIILLQLAAGLTVQSQP